METYGIHREGNKFLVRGKVIRVYSRTIITIEGDVFMEHYVKIKLGDHDTATHVNILYQEPQVAEKGDEVEATGFLASRWFHDMNAYLEEFRGKSLTVLNPMHSDPINLQTDKIIMVTECSFIMRGEISETHLRKISIGNEVFTECRMTIKGKNLDTKMDIIKLKQGSQMNIEDLPLEIIAKIERASK